MTKPIDPARLPPVVSPEWLSEFRATRSDAGSARVDVVVADVRWYLDGRSGRAAYEVGHIAGAVFVDLDTDLCDHEQPATSGRHPLPSPERFVESMRRLGIGDDTPVVAYDDAGGSTASRLVVMLRSLGRSAAVLDGGIAAWAEPLESGAARPSGSVDASFTVRPWPSDLFVGIEEAADIGAGTVPGSVLLDARAAERYRGEVEPIDPRAGHIPGAVNAPWSANIDPATGRFRAPDELREHYARLGVSAHQRVVCSCGSGVTACHDALALELAGFQRPAVFVASWSGWSNDPNRPVATGDPQVS
jgi:thiosulfate/3-mercaptopyruvate sulfurtransferase